MKNFKFIIIIILANVCHGQIKKGTVQYQYYNYCNENLKEMPQDGKFPLFKPGELCSIKNCFRTISYPETNAIIYKRIIEIAKLNFEKKIFLYLIEGEGSVEIADMKNENLEDDNNFIYISVDDFINAKEITIGKELYNSETEKLMKKR